MSRNSEADYGFARARDQAFDAVMRLWEVRKKEGFTQARLASAIGRDPGWVSRHLSGPGNWTLKTVGAFVVGLNGELEIEAHPLEKPIDPISNYDAYEEYRSTPEEAVIAISRSNPDAQPPKAESTPRSALSSDLLKRVFETPSTV